MSITDQTFQHRDASQIRPAENPQGKRGKLAASSKQEAAARAPDVSCT